MTAVRFCLLIAIGVVMPAAAQQDDTFYLLIQRDRLNAREVRALLAKGANPNMPGQHSVYPDTPLVAAIRNDNLPVVRVLVSAGADLNPGPGVAHDPPLHEALKRSDDIFLFLLNKGARPDQPDRFGRAPLYWAASPQHYDKAVMLIAAGADVHARTDDGWTMLMLAARHANVRLVELLIRKGVDVNATGRHGHTALDLAPPGRVQDLLRKHGATG